MRTGRQLGRMSIICMNPRFSCLFITELWEIVLAKQSSGWVAHRVPTAETRQLDYLRAEISSLVEISFRYFLYKLVFARLTYMYATSANFLIGKDIMMPAAQPRSSMLKACDLSASVATRLTR